MIRRLRLAAALLAAAAAALASPALAADPTPTSLPLVQGGTTYQQWTYNDGTRFRTGQLLFGWNGSSPKVVNVDGSTGDLIVMQGGAWSFGLTGTLPAFGATPTFNLGTLNGAATSALQQSILTALGTPLQAGGSVTVSGGPTAAGQTAANGSLATLAGAVSGGNVQVVCTSGCSGSGGGSIPSGSAGSPSASVLSVQGISGGTAVPVTGAFYQTTQPVSAAALPLPAGAATASGVSAVVTALGTPLQAGGSVSVSNLPATQAISAATLPLPTGAATASGVAAVVTALGAPLQAGGSVTVTGGPTAANQATANTSLASIATNTTPAGTGSMAAVPTGSTNGTALGCSASSFKGARFYLGTADSVTFTVATSAPSSAPASTYTISGATSGTGPNWDENLGGTAAIYVTAKAGSPLFRCY